MTYVDYINTTLQPKHSEDSPLVLDLFAGCGGLALGFEAQGFRTHGYEMDSSCCATYAHNLSGECEEVFLTPQYRFPKAQVVIGGPPCQPFSVGGYQHGVKDARNGFPSFISAVEQASPDIWMFENVRGLFYRNKDYFKEILSTLEQLGYAIEYSLFNVVNYSVPQNRERIIVIGHRGNYQFPEPLIKKITAGEALGDLAVQAPPESRYLTESMNAYIAKYEKASKCINPRDLHLDKPARTLTCRNLAGATGDMQRIKLANGSRRRLLHREAARLQSFPDWFKFIGNESSIFNQIGNAVPPMFSFHFAASIKTYLENNYRKTVSKNIGSVRPSYAGLPLFKQPIVETA